MAKITDKTALTSLASGDIFPIVDVSDTTDDAAGSSKKVTLGTIRQSAGALPTIVSVGSAFSGTGVPTATLPGTHAADDILVLCIQTSQQAFTTPTGYTRIGPANGVGDAAAAGATKLYLFWKRDNGSESAPTLSDSGDHTYGVMFAVRGCPTTGDPFRLIGQAWKFTASTTGTAESGISRVANSLIVSVFAHAVDSASAQGSSPTNSSLTSVTEQFDGATTDGTGGGLYVLSGAMVTPGDVSASTVTWASSTVDVSTTLAFVPADAFPVPRSAETQIFIGSSADLDDVYTKPFGARRVRVQTVGGGGSGSGGNTTTTAAGGGGGQGGGYDEAEYDAEDLGATTTLHPGRGGAAGTALNQAGTNGTVSWFDTVGPLISANYTAGTAATAAASADGGNGGCGGGKGTVAVQTTRLTLSSANTSTAMGARGAAGGSGTTAPTGGSVADWGGGGGESGADTDAGITATNNGSSMRGGGGGSGGRTNTNISVPGDGGGRAAPTTPQGGAGNDSTRLPYGGSGGIGGGSSTVTGGSGGFPGGGGGGGAGVAGGFGGRGGHGCIVVTTFF